MHTHTQAPLHTGAHTHTHRRTHVQTLLGTGAWERLNWGPGTRAPGPASPLRAVWARAVSPPLWASGLLPARWGWGMEDPPTPTFWGLVHYCLGARCGNQQGLPWRGVHQWGWSVPSVYSASSRSAGSVFLHSTHLHNKNSSYNGNDWELPHTPSSSLPTSSPVPGPATPPP